MTIIVPIIIGILLITWLQYPQIKKDKEEKKPIYIFNIIKIPIIFTCIVSIIYLIYCKAYIEPLRINQKVYMGLPRF
jgi:hypothetical protein